MRRFAPTKAVSKVLLFRSVTANLLVPVVKYKMMNYFCETSSIRELKKGLLAAGSAAGAVSCEKNGGGGAGGGGGGKGIRGGHYYDLTTTTDLFSQ